MDNARLTLISDAVSAVLWRIEDKIAKGVPFETAKKEAISEAGATWKGFSWELHQKVRHVAWSLSPADLGKATRHRMRERFLHSAGKHRGKPVGRIERAFHRITGRLF